MPTYQVKTFGCQMNVHDSERIEETLQAIGYWPAAAEEDADLLVVNTCSVRDKAEQKLRSLSGALGSLKQRRPGAIVAVAGCVAQQEGEALLKKMRHVDIVLGPDNIPELPLLIEAAAGGAPPVARTVHDIDDPVFLRAAVDARRGAAASAFVTVMKGCDERCSFCIVPHTRGPERYRPSSEIVAEIERLLSSGVREITLLGQTVNSYRDPERRLPPAPMADEADPDESEFAALLRAIAEQAPALARLRYTSPHPRHVTPSLVAAHRDLDVLARHVHLPVQSGSDRVLRRMIRRYTRAEYVERAASLGSARPGLTLSTDVIVGFPGETDEDFARTLALVAEVGFAGLFGFKYSRRPHTPAQKLADDVPEPVKSARLTALFALADKLVAEQLGSLVGRTERVLVEGESKAGSGKVTGRTERNEIVHVAASRAIVGTVVEVRLVRAFKHSLEGELMGPDAAGARPLEPPPVRTALGRRVLPVLGPGL
jgi:tRNA-2-methylthio-N6-dimethylallyladenosine synthase